uniref:Uncharacterized protein n=1 Tax=Physcomitrium patens TaxID=3218 RepID=A0A2K1J0A9_PHYPA|nr:hypothetical protein PHYPA_022866 [Physcomitrium patens]
MGGGPAEDWFLEGSVLGASFWRWWSSACMREPPGFQRDVETREGQPARASSSVPTHESEVDYITTVVPRRRRPAKSEPIDIPVKRTPAPVYESASDRRWWFR